MIAVQMQPLEVCGKLNIQAQQYKRKISRCAMDSTMSPLISCPRAKIYQRKEGVVMYPPRHTFNITLQQTGTKINEVETNKKKKQKVCECAFKMTCKQGRLNTRQDHLYCQKGHTYLKWPLVHNSKTTHSLFIFLVA